MTRTSRLRRWVATGAAVLAVAAVVPDAGHPEAQAYVLDNGRATGLDAHDGVTWVLVLGSDARPGQPVLGSRSDAIQLVGINARRRAAVTIGIPRDSYVSIPGHGQDKINAAMVYGGPSATTGAVAALTGIRPDYTFVTSFQGLRDMVNSVGGVRVYARQRMKELGADIPRGWSKVHGFDALQFARMRHYLPRGDFDRSLNQGRLLRFGVMAVQEKVYRWGFFERVMSSLVAHTSSDVDPVRLYRLGRTALSVDPAKVDSCVILGSTGMAGAVSVVYPDVAQVRRLVRDVRHDAVAQGNC